MAEVNTDNLMDSLNYDQLTAQLFARGFVRVQTAGPNSNQPSAIQGTLSLGGVGQGQGAFSLLNGTGGQILSMGTAGLQFYGTNGSSAVLINSDGFNNFFGTTGTASFAGTVGNGSSMVVAIELSDANNKPLFAMPYFAVYKGITTAGTGQIWPELRVGPAEFQIFNGNDWDPTADLGTAAWNGNNERHVIQVRNNSGGNQPMLFVAQYKYLKVSSTFSPQFTLTGTTI